ncbi:MAG: DUF4190 domain-containing protein [Actinomycetes bacterium]
MSKQERNEGKAGISDLTVIALVTSVLLPLVGWILGFRARKQIEQSEGKFTGRPFATAAIWIGGILTIGWLAMFAMMLACAGVNNNDDGQFGRGGFQHMGMGNHRAFSNNGNQGYQNDNGFPGGPGMMFQPDPSQSTNP